NLEQPYILLANNFIPRRSRSRLDQVRWDDQGGAAQAVEYLAELGHRDIWYIGDISLPWFGGPYEGYLRAMRARGLEPLAQTAALSDDPFLNGKASVEMLLEKRLPMTAIFADAEVAY